MALFRIDGDCTVTTFVALGATPAADGDLRLTGAGVIHAPTSVAVKANNSQAIVATDALVELDAGGAEVAMFTDGVIEFFNGADAGLIFENVGAIAIYRPLAATGLAITIEAGAANGAAAAGGDLALNAGDATGTGVANGGSVTITGGNCAGTGAFGGNVILQPGSDDADGGGGGSIGLRFFSDSGVPGNLHIGDSVTNNVQAMERGIVLQNATAQPSGNPTNAIFIYAEGSAGKARGGGGTVTTWAPSDPHCPRCDRDCAVEWENKDAGWHISVCMWCLTETLDDLLDAAPVRRANAQARGAGLITRTQRP